MKEFSLRFLLAIALAVGVSLPALADTIRLKDGSVLHGQVVGFKDQQVTILLGSGSRGRKSRITVYMEDVDSIEFDSTGSAANTSQDTNAGNTQPSYQPPSNSQPSYQPPPTNSTPAGSNPTTFQINVRVRGDNANNRGTNCGIESRRGPRTTIHETCQDY